MKTVDAFRFAAGCLFFGTVLFPGLLMAQTLGGNAAYNFLKLPPSPLVMAAGGVNISYLSGEAGSSGTNPALLQPDLHKQLNASFNSSVAGIKGYSLTGAFAAGTTTVAGHLFYLDYGNLPRTDASGNASGDFRPVDYVVQLSASQHYLRNWTYGLTLKYIHSSYGPYRSSALAADAGVLYRDSAKGLSASVVVKNMGTQLTTYAGEAEEVPFDLQVGLTKRLADAPFAFSATAQHLQTFDVFYNDTTFNGANRFTQNASFFSKAAAHLVLATHVYLGQSIEATIGYNVLQRQQLTIGTESNGLTGFSGGLRLRLLKMEVMYARTAYQRGVAANQLGLTIHLDRMFGLGN